MASLLSLGEHGSIAWLKPEGDGVPLNLQKDFMHFPSNFNVMEITSFCYAHFETTCFVFGCT